MAGFIPDRVFLPTLRENYSREKCCLICLKVVAPHEHKLHKKTEAHILLIDWLKKDIYPYSCDKCEMRFSTESDLILHTLEHSADKMVFKEKWSFSAVCCYLCRLPFESQEELDQHCSRSVEHMCRRQMILEMELRKTVVCKISEKSVKSEVFEASFEETASGSWSAVSSVQGAENLKSTNLSIPSSPLIYCELCSISLPASDMAQHKKEVVHTKLVQALIRELDNTNKWFNSLPEILSAEDEVSVLDSTSACSQEKLELDLPSDPYNDIRNGIDHVLDSDKIKSCGVQPQEHLKARKHSKNFTAFIAKKIQSSSEDNTFNSDLNKSTNILQVPQKKLPDKKNELENALRDSVPGVVNKDPNPTLLCSNPGLKVLSSQTYCSICCVAVPTRNMTEHTRGKNHIKNCNTHVEKCNSVDELTHLEQSKRSEVPKQGSKILVTDETLKIGDSTFACLQEEFEEVEFSSGKDLDDFVVECEICGIVFQTFNNNLDLSYDLHVQNDPQHALALAVPLERDAKQMAELSKTSTAPEKATKKARRRPRNKRKKTLLKSNASQASTQENKLSIQSGKTPEGKLVNPNSLPFFCKICNIPMTCGNKIGHLTSKLHIKKALQTNCTGNSKVMGHGENTGHFSDPKLKENANLVFSCKVCNRSMDDCNKESHLMGKLHKANALKLQSQ